MAKRVNIAHYVGRQPLPGNGYLDLYDLFVPLRNAGQNITHPIDSTMTDKLLKILVPNIVFPKGTNIHLPPEKGAIAYAVN